VPQNQNKFGSGPQGTELCSSALWIKPLTGQLKEGKLGEEAMSKLLCIIFRLKGIFKRAKKNFKGSSRDPFLYLGVFSAVLFISAVLVPCFCATLSLRSVTAKENPQSLFLSSINNLWPESPDFLLVQGSSLVGVAPPAMVAPKVLGALVGYDTDTGARNEIAEYIVEDGDTLSSIAERFEISLNTLLWANNLTKSPVLKIGQKLIVLPTTGVLHHVKSGDTVGEITLKYKGKVDEIIAFNGLASEGDIYVGDILIIPNGVMPAPSVQYAPQLVPIADSYFICPIAAPCRITQGLHFYNAVDFSHSVCGEPIYAAAGGQVIKVKLTTSTSKLAFGGAGNTISILHPNGVVTSYGHIAASLVNPGDQVSQGQIIAYMGGQPGTPGAGKSTGCHVHFGVSGARNPFTK